MIMVLPDVFLSDGMIERYSEMMSLMAAIVTENFFCLA